GCLAGLVTASRRVAGTRHLELDLGRKHPPVEIELPPERAASTDHTRIAFRPTRWKLFRKGGQKEAPLIEAEAPVLAATGT
ncbi:sulfate ABC transporter ATP-binding protein, partial [Sinorhizobium meliloti]